jgi:methylglutaconyl-CoA hydratase
MPTDPHAADARQAAEAIVAAILECGPEAVREAKRFVRKRPAGHATAEIAAAPRTSAEGQDGLRAFLERRRPSWQT